MQAPVVPENEALRQEVVDILDQANIGREERFDHIVEFARLVFQVPTALITVIDGDRQWFKAQCGIDINGTPRSVSFCGHTINSPDVMVVEDTLEDDRFRDNPLVTGSPHVRFYAGAPLEIITGVRIGSLCLLDTAPRAFSEEQKKLLRRLGDMARDEIVRPPAASAQDLAPKGGGPEALETWRKRFRSMFRR